ncbi:MAG TPA: magnesium transporter [Steroidobacteraceae bacterium]
MKVREDLLRALQAEPTEGSLAARYRMINALHPAEIASLLQSLPATQRKVLWQFIDPEMEGEVLAELEEPVRASLIREMDPQQLVAAVQHMDPDDLADLVAELPEAVTDQLLKSMTDRDRERLQSLLSYPEHSAGGLMNTDTVSVRPDVTVEVVLRYLRMRGELPEKTDCLFVVDAHDRYIGSVPLTRLVTEDPHRLIGDLVEPEAQTVDPDKPAHEVAQLFQDLDLISVPVVSAEGKLLGRITIDDIVDVIREEGDEAMLSMAGLPVGEDTFGGTAAAVLRRLPWLAMSAGTALLSASIIRQFEPTIQQVAVLAALMPIVASMGGVAGTQTVTLVIRGLALGQVRSTNAGWLLLKEAGVGALTGLIWAIVIGLLVVVWLGDQRIAAVMGAAMLINMLAAGTIGATIPMVLHRLRLDPALGAGVLLTTCTDIVGFATLLGVATLVLL